MKPINEMKLQFQSHSVNEAFARAAAAAFAAQLDPNIEELADLKTAVSEAVTNCIVHAYPRSVGVIFIWAGLYADGTVKVRIRDRGVGIPDIRQAMEPLFTTLGGERAGLGFAVMESFCDRVQVSSRVGKGTCVTLTRRFTGRDADG